jgi:hypothetical protein
VQNFRCIGQGGEDVRWRELRILRHDLIGCQAIGQASHDHSHRNARTSNTRLAVMNLWICAHSLLPCGTFHDGSLPHRLGFGTGWKHTADIRQGRPSWLDSVATLIG